MPCFVHAQIPSGSILDSIGARFSRKFESRADPGLFLHLDKSIYVFNENIWFTAYLTGSSFSSQQHTLHVVLANEREHKVVASDHFVVQSGLSKGSIFLPDSIPAGEYRLIAYTNSMLQNPAEPFFQQQISIRTVGNNPFTLSFLAGEKEKYSPDSIRFMYKVLTSYGGIASGGSFEYVLNADGKKIQSGKTKINAFGEIILTVSESNTLGKKLELTATVARQKEKQVIHTQVPLFQKTVLVKFYPEGGNLVNGHFNNLALELRNGLGIPVATTGVLLENNIPVADFKTGTDGIGILELTPKAGKNYTLQLKDSSFGVRYDFPGIAVEGYSLHIPQAVVRDSTFTVHVKSTKLGARFHLIVHNYRKIFYMGEMLLKGQEGSVFLPVETIPNGVSTVTLFDGDGVPRAERAVFIEKTPRLLVQMKTDSTTYHHRSKVKLTIKIADQEGNPVPGIFSLSGVLSTRIDSSRFTDIVRYTLFDRFLPASSPMPPLNWLSSDENMEMTLLTRFWSRYKWEDPLFTSPTPVVTSFCETGQVFYHQKPVKKPVLMMLLTGKQVVTFLTDSSGFFELDPRLLPVPADQKITLLVAEKKDFKEFRIRMNNPCSLADTAVAGMAFSESAFRKAELSVEEQQFMKTALKEVIVTAKNNDYGSGVFVSTTCADWVCMYNVLNCPNHPTGSTPVDGETYNTARGRVTYRSCVQDQREHGAFMHQIRGTYYPREFYVADYEKFNPALPERMSTIFWSHEINTNEKGEAEVSFFTNDLNGRFLCILQGYTLKGPISGACYFRSE